MLIGKLAIALDQEGHPRLRPHSTPATLCWLERNYELSEGVCIPRNVVYFNYVDFCSKSAMTPVNAATFGKVRCILCSHCTGVVDIIGWNQREVLV